LAAVGCSDFHWPVEIALGAKRKNEGVWVGSLARFFGLFVKYFRLQLVTEVTHVVPYQAVMSQQIIYSDKYYDDEYEYRYAFGCCEPF